MSRFSTVILLLLNYICTAALVQTQENGKRPGLWLLGNPAPHEMLPSHHCLVWIGNQTEQEQAAMYSKLCRNFPVPPSRTFIDSGRVRNRAAPPAADPSRKLLGLLPTGRHYKALLAKTTRFQLVSSPRWVSKISPTCTSCTLVQHCTFKCLCKYVHRFIYFHRLSFPLYV